MEPKPKNSPEELLALLEAIIRDAPMFTYGEARTEQEVKWLGRAEALLEASGSMLATMDFRAARDALDTYTHDRNNLLIPLHTTYSRIELQAPISQQGAFIPSGDTWNGYAALVNIINKANNDVLIVDPYISAEAFLHFFPHSTATDGIRCLTAKRSADHAGILAALTKWRADEIAHSKPVALRYGPARSLHDRLIIIDKDETWLISQSIKDIAKRSPASVTRADSELSKMKAEHYAALWEESDPVS